MQKSFRFRNLDVEFKALIMSEMNARGCRRLIFHLALISLKDGIKLQNMLRGMNSANFEVKQSILSIDLNFVNLFIIYAFLFKILDNKSQLKSALFHESY